MRKRLPPLATLLAFEAVADLGSFTKAGDSLMLTHSAISHQLRQLEAHLDVRLLNRTPSGVRLTPEGAIYLAEIKEALKILENATGLARQHLRTRPLRISVLASFASSMVVPELRTFMNRNPSVTVEIDARAGLEAEGEHDIDVFIRYGNGAWPNYQSIRLTDVDLFPVCSPEYLNNHGPIAKLSDLSRVVLLRHPAVKWDEWLRAVDPSGEASIIPAGPLYSDARLMLSAVCDGQGVGLARDVLVEPELRSGRVVRLFEYHVTSSQGYYAYFRQGADSEPSIRLFLDWLVETCERKKVRG